MRHVVSRFSRLSRFRQTALAAAVIGCIATVMPWHTIGSIEFGTQQAYSGFADQNFIIGVLTFACLLAVVLVLGVPLLGFRGIRTTYSDGTLLTFFGGEASLVTCIAFIQHSTAMTRSVSESIQIGLYLALIASLIVLVAGYFLRREQPVESQTFTEPFRVPRRHTLDDLRADETSSTESSRPVTREPPASSSAEDRRMKLDL